MDLFGIGEIASSLINLGGDIWQQDRAESMQDHSQNFTRSENALARDFNERMYKSRYQMQTADLQAAGLNPMLAYQQSPGAAPHSPAGAGTAGQLGQRRFDAVTGMQTAAQIQLLSAEADKVKAEADEVRARTPRHAWDIEEIRARIPTHSAQVDNLRQQIGESSVRIERIWQDIEVGKATAANVQQQTKNLQETIHLIRGQVMNLKALTDQASAATSEIKQRVAAQLPDLERKLMDLERIERQMAQPGHMANEAAQASFAGQIGAYLRALNPLQSFIGSYRGGTASNTTVHRTGPTHTTIFNK